MNPGTLKIALMDAFPNFNAPGFDIVTYNQRFHNSNIIIRANSNRVGFPEHWGGLSVKCAFGGYEYYESGDDFFAVDASNYLVFNEGKNYSSFIDSRTTVESFTVNFTPELERLAWHTMTSATSQLLDSPDKTSATKFRLDERLTHHDATVSPLVYALRRLSGDWTKNHDDIQEYLLLLLEALIRRHHATKSGESVQALKMSTRIELLKRLTRAAEYLDANYHQPVSLGDLADITCMNAFYFLRQFKKMYRVTPHHYLQQKRMSQAASMLRNDHLSITEVCNKVGFADPASFGKLFRRYFDQTPGKFRNMCLENWKHVTGNPVASYSACPPETSSR